MPAIFKAIKWKNYRTEESCKYGYSLHFTRYDIFLLAW